MGAVKTVSPVHPLIAAFSRHEAALDWATARATERFGPVALASPRFDFAETSYYAATMGDGIKKTFLFFAQPRDPAELAEWKLLSNDWEDEYAQLHSLAETRPLNLDPGYLTLPKVVLASTKDHAHRMYLSQGIYAEVTLHYKHGRWQPHDWTFPDYRRADYHAFFDACRALIKPGPRPVA